MALNEAIVAIKTSIEDEGGLFNLKLQVNQLDDLEIRTWLKIKVCKYFVYFSTKTYLIPVA